MKNLLALIFLLLVSIPSIGQKYKGFRYIQTTNEYGRPMLKVEPNHVDGYAPDDTKKWRIYGMRLCYTVNGKQKAARQDITEDIVTKKEYFFQLSMLADAKVSIEDVQFFSLLTEESSWPKKEDCFDYSK